MISTEDVKGLFIRFNAFNNIVMKVHFARKLLFGVSNMFKKPINISLIQL